MIKLQHLIEADSEALKQFKDNTEEPLSPLSTEEKKTLIKTIEDYNTYRNSLKSTSVYDTINKISEAIALAERYVVSKSEEWMQAEMAKRDIKEIKRLTDKLDAESTKLQTIESNIELIYEDIGLKLDRYFEIKDNEDAKNVENTQSNSTATPETDKEIK